MLVKQRDIAKRAGVSAATVSRVLNKSARVSEKTARKVLKVLERVDYYPNFTARSLRRGVTTTVGFVLPNIASSFFGKLALAIETELRKRNCDLTIYNTERKEKLELRALRLLVSQKVAGIIFAPITLTNSFAGRIHKVFKIPLVVVDNKLENLQVPAVLHDDIEGAYELTSHLITCHGHRKIAFLGGWLAETSGLRRLEGYKKALADHDIPLSENFIKIGEWDIKSGLEMTRKLLKPNGKPTAIVLANTYIAIGCILALQEKKIKIPEQMALVSFDDLDFCSALSPSLTTLSETYTEIGQTAARLLLNWIKRGKADSKEFLIRTDIVRRASCGCNV